PSPGARAPPTPTPTSNRPCGRSCPSSSRPTSSVPECPRSAWPDARERGRRRGSRTESISASSRSARWRRGHAGFCRAKQARHWAAKPRHDVLARQLAIGPEPVSRPVATDHLDRTNLGMDDPDQPHSRPEILLHLLFKLVDPIAGRGDLDGKVRRDPDVTLRPLSLGRKALACDEHDVLPAY